MIVALARLALRIPHSRSLKDKRAVIRKIKDRVRARFDVSVAEVDGQDTWQRAVLGLALVGSDGRLLESRLDELVRFVEGLGQGELYHVDRETLTMGDLAIARGGRLGD